MESYVVYSFLGVFLALSLLIYANLLVVQFFGLRFGRNEKQSEMIIQGLLVTSISFLWYAISLSFTLYNKWLLQEWHTGFHFPIIITMVHMIMKYFITRVWALTPEAEAVPEVPWKVLSSIVIPIGLFTSADIVFSNIAIYFLPLSMYTAIKGSTLVFTFALGVMCRVEAFQWSLFIAVLGIAGGLGLAIATYADHLSLYGLLCVLLSAAASAGRWVLMQVLALRDRHSDSVMVTLYRFSPYSALSIVPFALAFETPGLVHSGFADSWRLLTEALLFSVFGGVVSFLLIVVEVKLLRVTSSLTMCVIGQIKEVIQIGAAMLLFKDHFTLRSGVGILVSIGAAYWYRSLKSGAATEEEGLDERRATLQILQSSQLAHRGVRGMRLQPDGYIGVNTTVSGLDGIAGEEGMGGMRGGGAGSSDTEDEGEDEGEALLVEQGGPASAGRGNNINSSSSSSSSGSRGGGGEGRRGRGSGIRETEMTQLPPWHLSVT